MLSFRTTTDVDADRRVVLDLPPDTPLGKAELVVVVVPQGNAEAQGASLPAGLVRRFKGAVRTGDSHSADNERIDADLASAYGAINDE